MPCKRTSLPGLPAALCLLLQRPLSLQRSVVPRLTFYSAYSNSCRAPEESSCWKILQTNKNGLRLLPLIYPTNNFQKNKCFTVHPVFGQIISIRCSNAKNYVTFPVHYWIVYWPSTSENIKTIYINVIIMLIPANRNYESWACNSSSHQIGGLPYTCIFFINVQFYLFFIHKWISILPDLTFKAKLKNFDYK